MGCTASKVDNEDTVRRCKERRRLMKEAVLSRHHLAAAHSDYLRSLRQTASALSVFASFQSLSVSSDASHPILLRPRIYHPTPPPLRPQSLLSPPQPLRFSAPSMKEENKTLPPKYSPLPANSTYATTPSQSSSAWNWENFYPPSPPGSDFFDRLNCPEGGEEEPEVEDEEGDNDSRRHHLPEEKEDNGVEEDGNGGRQEVHCNNWGDDRYSRTTTSSTTRSDDGREEEESRFEGVAARSDFYGSSAASVDYNQQNLHHRRHLDRAPTSEFSRSGRKERFCETEAEEEESTIASQSLQIVVRHRDLKEIVASIEEYFLNAANAGEPVSGLLETSRVQLDRSFRQLKKTVYHSSSVLSNLSSTWTSKPPLAIKYQLDTAALEDSGGRQSHCCTLDRLLAWEKKLYEEVKAREGVKIEHEKKLSSLQNQEYKGKNDAKLDKTKAAINRLQSLILVTSQAVCTTSSAIVKVRDDELAPQLVELCYRFLQMWRLMNQFHEVQNRIVQQVRGLVNHSSVLESTSDLHRQATRDLESSVSDWHSSFTRLIKFHRDYIRTLYAWLKLTLFRVSNEEFERDHYSSLVSSELTSFCDEWKQALDQLPDTVAAEAIKSFVNVIHSISLKQTEELKIKKRVESYSKELEKKTLALRNIEKKFYKSYSMVGIGIPDGGSDSHGQVFDSRDPLVEKKMEIAACRRKVEDEMAKHTKAIKVTREMTLNNIQTGLPGLFQAMTGFSGAFTEVLEGVCQRGGHHR